MKNAILIVGGERNVVNTIGGLRRNLLEPNRPVLFFAVETDNPERVLQHFDGFEIGGNMLLPTFRNSEYHHILSMCLERPGLSEEVFRRARQSDGLAWDSSYIVQSGTLLQYYQLWKAWSLLLDYERKHRMKFDFCVKWRLDMLLTRPLVFADIPSSGSEEILRSMGNEYMLEHTNPKRNDGFYEHGYGHPVDDNIVWSFGHEQVFMSKRKNFEIFGSMVFWFGTWDSGGPFAFNSETFFHQVCLHNQCIHWIFLEDTNPLFTHDINSAYMMTLLR